MRKSNNCISNVLFDFIASRSPTRPRHSTTLGLVLLLLFSFDCASFAEVTMTVTEKTVVGQELRVVLATSRTVQAPGTRRTTTQDVKGYLIVVDLSSKAPTTQRSHVYGPLWDVPQPRSQISFSSGANFTKEDADAALATPHCAFDENGELIRFRNDLARKQILFDRLDLASASWKQPASFAPIDNKTPPMSEDQVVSPSGRYMLLYQDGTARLYDVYTGQEKTDPWLTGRFAESRQIPKFKNVSIMLTDDLDHLVVSPRAIWNEGFGATVHESFTFGGKILSRAQYFLCADRPEPSLGIVQRKPDERAFLNEAPTAAYTIERQLMLMHSTENAIRLYRRDGTVAYHSEAKVPSGWRNGALGTRHISADGRLVFFTVDFDQVEQVRERHVALNVWDYRRGIVTSHVVPVVDLFREDNGYYVVRDPANPVK